MLRTAVRSGFQAYGEVPDYVPKRGFKRVKISMEAIKKAQAAQLAKKKASLESYYGKVKGEKVDKEHIDEREKMTESMAKGKKDARKNMRKIRSKGADMSYMPWRQQQIDEMRDRTAYGNDPSLSERMRRKAYELYKSSPHYWTPIRLASLFKTTSPIRLRSILYACKLEEEAREAGVMMDDTIEEGMGEIFGEVDFLNDFDGKPPAEIPIRKVHNPWYYINPALKSAELLKFLRSKESIYYRESSRIPAQRVEPVVAVSECLASGTLGRRSVPNKRPPWTCFDISPSKTLYDRQIVVREKNGTWRTGNWDERRRVHDLRRYLKYPYHIPFAWPDEKQPDGIAISAKPPPSFEVRYEGEDDSFFLPKTYNWSKLRDESETRLNEEKVSEKAARDQVKADKKAAKEAKTAAA
jgi:hypothetical protein